MKNITTQIVQKKKEAYELLFEYINGDKEIFLLQKEYAKRLFLKFQNIFCRSLELGGSIESKFGMVVIFKKDVRKVSIKKQEQEK